MIPYKQLSLAEIYSDCKNFFEGDKPQFLSLLEENLCLDEFIPLSFYQNFYVSTGRPRKYELRSMLWALLLQKIFSIPSDTLLISFLRYSKELRDFCGFTSVPDNSKFTRFKQDFLYDLQKFFDRLVDITEPICQEIDSVKASMIIFDTSGIEAYVTENNPKYINKIVKGLKAYKKSCNLPDSYDPYKAAYGSMPSHAESNSAIKNLYTNGHFCYAYKFGMVTNGLGIARDISFFNKDFLNAHRDIIVGKKSNSPEDDKSLHDSKVLKPVLSGFFQKHPHIVPKIFLADSAFDSTELYKYLLTELKFKQVYIPLNKRSSKNTQDYAINASGIPCCPKDPSLPMKQEGNTSHLRSGVPTRKFVCPKMKWIKCEDGKHRRRHSCLDPCTDSPSGRMIYIYPERDLRLYPGTIRDTEKWDDTYKIRVVVERSLHHFKDNFCIANRKTQNEKTLHADLLLSGITQLITVVLTDKIHQHKYIRSLKPLIA